MNDDVIIGALAQSASIAINVAYSTQTCQSAQALQTLQSSSALALGRLLTAAALMAHAPLRPGPLSLQIVCSGRLKQIFADITEAGHLRGYVKQTDLALSVPGETKDARRSIGALVGEGQLSVIRLGHNFEFAQSTTEISTGEIDTDVQKFLETSDQIASILICDAFFDEHEKIEYAGGILLQAMPGYNPETFQALRTSLQSQAFTQQLKVSLQTRNTLDLVQKIHPEAQIVGVPHPIQWRCRCSEERVLGAIKTIPPAELAEMIDRKEAAIVHCDFCLKRYEISSTQIEQIFLQTVTGKN